MNKKWIERIYGRDGVYESIYLTRIRLLNSNPQRLGMQSGLFLHKFHRGDSDRDFHDHPWCFWTFPFRDYYEDVLTPTGGVIHNQKVPAFKWTFRLSSHAHRIRDDQPFPLYTVVLPGIKAEKWGFYVSAIDAQIVHGIKGEPEKTRGALWWVPWKAYVFGMEE